MAAICRVFQKWKPSVCSRIQPLTVKSNLVHQLRAASPGLSNRGSRRHQHGVLGYRNRALWAAPVSLWPPISSGPHPMSQQLVSLVHGGAIDESLPADTGSSESVALATSDGEEARFPLLEQMLMNADSIDDVLRIVSDSANRHYLRNSYTLQQCFFSFVRLAGGKTAMAKLEDKRAQDFLDFLIQEVPRFPMNRVTLCLRFCAKNRFHDRKLISALVDECQRRPLPKEFTASVLWSLVTLGFHKETKELFMATAHNVANTLAANQEPIPLANLANIVYVLTISGHWVKELTPSLIQYLDVHLDEWEDFYSLAVFVWALVKQRVNLQQYRPALLAEVGRVAAKHISTKRVHPLDLNMLSWSFAAKGAYQEDYFHSLANKFTTADDPDFFEPRMLSSVAWAASRVRFYSPELLDCISKHSLEKLDRYNSHDLGNLAYAFARLNHPDRQLLEAIVDRVESDPRLLENRQSCYNIAWACMVMELYPVKLLQHALSPTQVEGMVSHTTPGAYSSFYDMMQLYIAVTVERPELGAQLGLHESVKQMILTALFKYLDTNKYQHSVSVFDINLQRALKGLTGDYRNFTNQPMTTSGYIFDGEVLLTTRNQVVRPPRAWKHRTAKSVQKILFSFSGDSACKPQCSRPDEDIRTNHSSQSYSDVNLGELLSSMKNLEDGPGGYDVTQGGSPTSSLNQILQSYSNVTSPGSVSGSFSKMYVNLASDWETVLNQYADKPVVRRIAIEADGPRHFAINCRHPLGHTVLKHRQLQALGWEVISLPYYEWKHLRTDQDQVCYLQERIFKDR